MIGPGEQPTTIQDKRAAQTSGFTQVFSEQDSKIDSPNFPIVLVSNGIHHMVPTKKLSFEHFTNWKLGLVKHHLNQAVALWKEVDPKPTDGDFDNVQTELFGKLLNTSKDLVSSRVNPKRDQVTVKTHLGGDPGKEFPFTGNFVPSKKQDFPSDIPIRSISTPAAAALLPVPKPSVPGTSDTNPIIFSDSDASASERREEDVQPSTSQMDIPVPTSQPTPFPTSQPIPSQSVITIQTGHNRGIATGKKRMRRQDLLASQGYKPQNVKKYQCPTPGCTHREARKNDLDDHIYVVHQGGIYQCSTCPSHYRQKRALNAHIKTKHNGIARCKCQTENCDYSTNDYGKLIGHKFTEHGIGTELKCLHCGKTFTNERSYDYHITHTHEAKSYKCSKCKRWFKLKSKLLKHWNDYHKENPKHMCHICGGTFQNSNILDKHVSTHSTEEDSKANILRQIDSALTGEQEEEQTQSNTEEEEDDEDT